VPSAQRDGIVAMTKENFGFHNTATAKSTNQGVGKPVATNHFNSIKVWFQKFFKNLKFYALIIVLAVILFFAIFFLILYFSL
jgi:hypothetical protein